MTIQTTCPNCNKTLNLPDGAAGKRVKCSGCATVCKIHENESGDIELHAVESKKPVVTVECPECGAEVDASETYCSGCGTEISEDTREAIEHEGERQERIASGRERRSRRHSAQRKEKIASSAKILIALSIIFALFGTFMGIRAQGDAKDAHANLAGYEATDELELDGTTWTVGELRAAVDQEVLAIFLTNYFLAAVMLGIYFWARKAPLPALITGFGVFLSVHVLNAIIEPASIGKGILVKVFFTVAFIGGIKAALAHRAAEERGEEPLPRTSSAPRRRRSQSA